MGLGGMVSTKKDSIGSVLSRREALVDPEGLRLVGLRSVSAQQKIIGGSHLLPLGASAKAENDAGYVTSVAYSPTLEGYVALAYLQVGDQRHGEVVRAWSGLHDSETLVEVVSPHFYDPEGGRQRD
jgi:sarcosine oxidase subunit alpha